MARKDKAPPPLLESMLRQSHHSCASTPPRIKNKGACARSIVFPGSLN